MGLYIIPLTRGFFKIWPCMQIYYCCCFGELGSTSQSDYFWLWEVLPKVTIFDFRKYFPNYPFLALGSTSQTTIFWLWEVLPKLPFFGFGKYFPNYPLLALGSTSQSRFVVRIMTSKICKILQKNLQNVAKNLHKSCTFWL